MCMCTEYTYTYMEFASVIELSPCMLVYTLQQEDKDSNNIT